MAVRFVAVLLFSVLSSLVCPLRATSCAQPMSRQHFVRRAYDANLPFIRNGVPAIAVDSFFRRSVINVIHKCSCNLTHVSSLCSRLHFHANYTDRPLLAAVTHGVHHDQKVGRIRYFPLYHPHHVLRPLKSNVTRIVNQHAHSLQQFLAPLDSTQLPLLQWTQPIFPSEDHLFRANFTTRAIACRAYREHNKLDTTVYISAKKSIAFALGVVQVLRYARGDVPAATRLLSEHTRYVYNAAICLHKSAADLPIPKLALDPLIESSKALLSTALEQLYSDPAEFVQFYQYHLPAPTQLENIHYISEPPLRMFEPLVHQFASISSGGLATTYLDFETSHGNSLTVRLTEDLLSSTNPYDYLGLSTQWF